jgi:hypothetical protein
VIKKNTLDRELIVSNSLLGIRFNFLRSVETRTNQTPSAANGRTLNRETLVSANGKRTFACGEQFLLSPDSRSSRTEKFNRRVRLMNIAGGCVVCIERASRE